MTAFKHTPTLWDYLDSTGVLFRGIDSEIKAAKKEYRKNYLLAYKKWQRGNKPEYSVYISRDNGELQKVKTAARTHRMTISGYLKLAVLAYIDKSFVVPDSLAIAKIEALLSKCYTEIQMLAKDKRMLYFAQLDEINKIISGLEKEISVTLREPISVEDFVKNAIEKDATLKERLLTNLLSYDCKDKNSTDAKLQATA